MGHQLKGCAEEGFVYCSICKQEMPKVSVSVIPCVELAWTTDPPTKHGWYWWRGNDESGKILIRVVGVNADLYCTNGFANEMGGEWAGPLEPPV